MVLGTRFRWLAPPETKVDDAIAIHMVDTGAVDPPTDRKTPAQLREEERCSWPRWSLGRPVSPTRPEFPRTRSAPRRVSRNLDDDLPPFAAWWE